MQSAYERMCSSVMLVCVTGWKRRTGRKAFTDVEDNREKCVYLWRGWLSNCKLNQEWLKRCQLKTFLQIYSCVFAQPVLFLCTFCSPSSALSLSKHWLLYSPRTQFCLFFWSTTWKQMTLFFSSPLLDMSVVSRRHSCCKLSPYMQHLRFHKHLFCHKT